MSDVETMTSTTLMLFRKVEDMVDALGPKDYTLPPLPRNPTGTVVIGDATEVMKKLWTLFMQLNTNQQLGETELLLRAVHVAMGYEVGKQFNKFGVHFGLTSTWQVFIPAG